MSPPPSSGFTVFGKLPFTSLKRVCLPFLSWLREYQRFTAMLSTRPVFGSTITWPWANLLRRFSLSRMCSIADAWIFGSIEVTTL
jgi:hypothetical protein